MGSNNYHYIHVLPQLLLVAAFHFLVIACDQACLNRTSFPAGFVFGTSSSAYQYEGAVNVDGRGPSIWDTFTRLHPGKIEDHSSGVVAEEFYYHYKDDIALMKNIGFDSFRFSLSWPRILPGGRISAGVNWEGVQFYNNLINELLSNDIKPLVTLFHWDSPQALDDEYGGFLSHNIVDDYQDYADFCFKEFGDRVKHWITFNEPNIFIGGYDTGLMAPGRCSNYVGNCTVGNSGTEPYIVVHNMILAHANTVNLYRDKYQVHQKGEIGIVVSSDWRIPKFNTISCNMAASRALDFLFGWIVHPIIFGDYPETMQSLVGHRLPKFSEQQAKLVKGSIDFLGLNYYTARYAEDIASHSSIVNVSYSTDSHVNLTIEKDGIPIGESTAASWLYVYPKGIEELTLYIKKKYNNPPLYITENGVAGDESSMLKDKLRIKYHYLHLAHLLKAIKAGADVRGYYVWTFLDDFEWHFGYTVRFGIIYVDYKNKLQRLLKDSALWFKNFLQKDVIIKQHPSYTQRSQ